MKKTAIYPGTFDPITYGHIDVIRRSLKVVSKLIIAVSNDYSKNSSAWKSVFAYNRSNNYVGVIMELRQEIKKGVMNNGL